MLYVICNIDILSAYVSMFDISRLVAKTFCTIGIHWNKSEIHQRSNCRM